MTDAELPAFPPAAPEAEAGPRPAELAPGAARRDARAEVIYRHTVLVRITHWVNAVTFVFLLGSGLNIFNAHPQLYWGRFGSEFDHPFLSIHAVGGTSGVRGMTMIGPFRFDTTGWLGWSRSHGMWMNRAWPSWITIPSYQDLADARHWHFFFAWILTANSLLYLAWSLIIGHTQRDVWPTAADLRSIPRSVWDHVRLRHPTGDAARRYNVLQRLAYLTVMVLVGGMIVTGLCMSPGMDAAAHWIVEGLGGRQSARSLHFLFATGLVLFLFVHLVEVVLAGPINEVGSMITGRYRLPKEAH